MPDVDVTQGFTRYVAVETAISVAANAAIGAAAAALAFHGQRFVPVAGAHGLVGDALPQTFMGVGMSVLVPLLLTRRRRRLGRLDLLSRGPEPSVWRVVLAAVLVAVLGTAVGVAFVAAVLPRIAGSALEFGAMLRFKAAYGALAAGLATPAALLAALRPHPRRASSRVRPVIDGRPPSPPASTMRTDSGGLSSHTEPPFKEGASSFGAFYPKHYVLAIVADDAAAAQAGDALRAAGFAPDDVVATPGTEVVAHAGDVRAGQGVLTRLLEQWSRLYTDGANATRQMIGLARRGRAVVLAYAPDDVAMTRAADTLRPLGPEVLRYFGTFTVTDLAGHASGGRP